jgi:phosphoribosylaminoimidazole carboxylase PurE protein
MNPKPEPSVAILIGSDSDLEVLAEAVRVLNRLDIPYEIHVASAHRSPERTAELVRSAPERGVRVFVAGAGAAAHLAGMVAAHTTLPVLGVPLASTDLGGLDALLSTAQMPAGIPVATLAIGKPGAANAAWLAAEILALGDPALADRLRAERQAMANTVATTSQGVAEALASLLRR